LLTKRVHTFLESGGRDGKEKKQEKRILGDGARLNKEGKKRSGCARRLPVAEKTSKVPKLAGDPKDEQLKGGFLQNKQKLKGFPSTWGTTNRWTLLSRAKAERSRQLTP